MRIEGVRLGVELPGLRKPITLVQMVAYIAATWDFHRYHYDPDFARAMGLPEPIADGQMFGAFLATRDSCPGRPGRSHPGIGSDRAG